MVYLLRPPKAGVFVLSHRAKIELSYKVKKACLLPKARRKRRPNDHSLLFALGSGKSEVFSLRI